MNSRRPRAVRALILALLLAVGPLQAHVVFACEMMGTVMHDTCCCDAHERCAGADCDDTLESEAEACCEVSAALSIDQDADQSKVSPKKSDLRADADLPATPPPATFASEPVRLVAAVNGGRTVLTVEPSGSRLYLSTQRLRI